MKNKIDFFDNSDYEYNRFSLEEKDGRIWFIDNEEEVEEEVLGLEGSLESILNEGKNKGFWYEEGDDYYYDFELEFEMLEYLGKI